MKKRMSLEAEQSLAEQTAQRKDPDEKAHLESVCDAFRQYATFARYARAGHTRRIDTLPDKVKLHLPRALIAGTPEAQARDQLMRDAEVRNQFFFDSMLVHAGIHNSQEVLGGAGRDMQGGRAALAGLGWSTDENISKVSSVLKSLSRDWSEDGIAEREMCYRPILNAIQNYYSKEGSVSPRVCVPGAGLGRLALEICAMGYEVQGNEFSMHMLLASDFILNGGATPQRQFAISPWLMESKNVQLSSDVARKVYIPDVDPAEMLFSDNYKKNVPEFSMSVGDFVSIYSSEKEKNSWDCVASCFFLDTAPCVIEYLEVIYNMLNENGILVNFGPLLYHWSGPNARPDDWALPVYSAKYSNLDNRYLVSVDMSWEDLRESILSIGFEILEEQLRCPAKYTCNNRSFLSNEYKCIYFVAKKTSRSTEPV